MDCFVDGYGITCLKGMDLKCTGMIDNVDRHRLTLLKGLDLYIDGHGLTLFINVDSEDWWVWTCMIDGLGLTWLMDLDLYDWWTWTYMIDGYGPTILTVVDLHGLWAVNEFLKLVVKCLLHQSDEIQDCQKNLNCINIKYHIFTSNH